MASTSLPILATLGITGVKKLRARQGPRRRHTVRIGEALITDGVIDEQMLRLALERQLETGDFLGETIATLGLAPASMIGQYLSQAMGFPYADLSEAKIDADLAHELPEQYVRRKMALPYQEEDDEVLVALSDPLNIATVDEIRGRLNRRIVPVLVFSFDLEDAINRAFTVQRRSESLLAELGDLDDGPAEEELASLALDAPIVRLVNGMLEAAARSGASDVHIEPAEQMVRIRFRVDGLLHEQMTIPRANLPAVVSRIKIISGMNIAERRRPQDGRFAFSDDDAGEFDIRVSTMSTIYGEKVVMRLLERTSSIASTEKLGFFPEQQEEFERLIKRPNGIILVTGPTGSGKSTTMMAALKRINDPSLNISTIEDPVEQKLAGTNQVAVNHKVGVDFATGLRTLVRQDPDVIMVGEIRDGETAEIAIQAALTGHLVLSTLHTNDAPGSLVRLQHMGVEPFLISSAVIGVVAQRLLRTVCPSCREDVPIERAFMDEFGIKSKNGELPLIARGRGCTKCGGRGLRGRTAACEIMPMTEGVRDLLLKRASGTEIMVQACADGMVTMRESGIRKVLEGITTPEEVVRVLYTEGQ